MAVTGVPITAGSGMTTTVTAALTIMDRVLKTTYADAKKTDALRYAGNLFLRQTQCTITASEAFTFTSGDETVDIGATITDFRPEAFLSMYLTASWRPVRKRSYGDLIRLYRNDTSTGYPKFIAWDSTSNALVWPDPDANYATRITYVPLLVDLTTGSNVINIPDKFIDALLWFGAAPLVEFNNPNAGFQSPAWQRFVNEVIPEARNECRVDTGFEVGIAEDDYDDADTIE